MNSLMTKYRDEKFSFIYIRLDNSKYFYKFEKCLNIWYNFVLKLLYKSKNNILLMFGVLG